MDKKEGYVISWRCDEYRELKTFTDLKEGSMYYAPSCRKNIYDTKIDNKTEEYCLTFLKWIAWWIVSRHEMKWDEQFKLTQCNILFYIHCKRYGTKYMEQPGAIIFGLAVNKLVNVLHLMKHH